MTSDPRVPAMDRLRGLIMILMALDHANEMVARRHSTGEYWAGPIPSYPDALSFLARFVTHFCAPGFFFLMGVSMTLFAASRRTRGWSEDSITKHHVLRGVVLMGVNQFVENPAWILGSAFLAAAVRGVTRAGGMPEGPGGGGEVFIFFTVLTGLGLCLIGASWMIRLPTRTVVLMSIAAIVATQALTPDPSRGGELFPIAVRLLMIPGQTAPAFVLYPMIPWLGLVGLGIAYGRWLLVDRDRAVRMALPIGMGLVIGALMLRAWGGFGNIRPPAGPGWIAFLNVNKYPPSLVFQGVTLGVDLVLLSIFAWMDARRDSSVVGPAMDPLSVFGRTAMFFYLAHLYLYGVVGLALGPDGIGIPAMLPIWVAGLAALYPLCRAYEKWKRAKQERSFWRLF